MKNNNSISLMLLAILSFLFVSCEKVDLQNEEDETKIEEKIDDKEENPDSDKPHEESAFSFPQEADVWEGHVVAYSEPIDDEKCECLLISLDAWRDVVSAYNEDNPTNAKVIADRYKEHELDGWTIPTLDQATKLRDVYLDSEMFDKLNKQLLENGGKKLWTNDENSTYARYLCDDSQKSFSFVRASYTAKAGPKKGYRLKLVKSITISKK